MKSRPAQASDCAAIELLLVAAGLPVDGAREHVHNFIVLENSSGLVGAVGLELYGKDALLRSLVVAQNERGKGFGKVLYRAAIEKARQHRIDNIYLLTETAEAFFAKRGFARIERASASRAVQQSVEFRSACPASAACMKLRLI